ncbi:hypothetical protein NOS3756_10860 [Nostoc sp. NIES-3756]|nr:hypothetical protein NOS3756_10860 [Nostoc sp. NIES-3756]
MVAIASIILPGAIAHRNHKKSLPLSLIPIVDYIKTKPNPAASYVPALSTTYSHQSCIYQQP